MLLLPFLANAPALLGLVHYAPELRISGLDQTSLASFKGFIPGRPYIDPNVGNISQTLGHVAALAWLHGHVPWWNALEGLGMPLGASMQSAAFLPLTLLQALPQGTLLFHLAMECTAGLGCYALLRELRCSAFAAASGSIAFELGGTFAWLTNSAMNPLVFLPLCLLGIELVTKATTPRRRQGWIVLALGVWLSIVAGFPEVAIINGLLVACWFVLRLQQNVRGIRSILPRAALGLSVGLLLAAPLLNAFIRYIESGNVGPHARDLAGSSLPSASLALYVSPYVFGGIFESTVPSVVRSWDDIGGYTGVALIVLACAALFSRGERPLRLLLGVWAAIFLGSTFDVPVLHQLVGILPGLANVAVVRYATPSVLLCLCILAAFCLDDVRGASPIRLFVRFMPGCCVVIAMFCIGLARTAGGISYAHAHLGAFYLLNFLQVGGTIALLCLPGPLWMLARRVVRRGRDAITLREMIRFRTLSRVLLGFVLCAEASVLFMVTIVEWPRSSHMDLSSVAFLRKHLGSQRFFSLYRIAPNYGAFYGLQSLDATDLPVPKNWATYVHSELSPSTVPWLFGNGGVAGPTAPSTSIDLIANLLHYENSGVRYLVVPREVNLSSLYQPPHLALGATPDGGTTLDLTYVAGSFVPGASIRALTIVGGGVMRARLSTRVCSAAVCVANADVRATQGNEVLRFASPLTLGSVIRIHLASLTGSQVSVMTVPSIIGRPATVSADAVLLPDRTALVHFSYVPSTLPVIAQSDPVSRTYRLPTAAPIASARDCSVSVRSLTSFVATCRHRSELVYRELSFPGWSADVNGVATRVTTIDSVFQGIPMQPGTSVVTFAYAPPGAAIAWFAMALGAAAIGMGLIRRRWPRLTVPTAVEFAISESAGFPR